MPGILYERKCSACNEICHPITSRPVKLSFIPMDKADIGRSYDGPYVALYICDKCNFLNYFEIDDETVRYFEDLIIAEKHEEIHNPTKICKDCKHEHRDHSSMNCLGVNEENGNRVQNCKCMKFAFNKTITKIN